MALSFVCIGKRAENTILRTFTRNISGQEIAVALDGTILEGDFPKGKMKLLEAWMEIHREELEANWTLISNGEQVSRVDPLK